jgi:hypothetical protein
MDAERTGGCKDRKQLLGAYDAEAPNKAQRTNSKKATPDVLVVRQSEPLILENLQQSTTSGKFWYQELEDSYERLPPSGDTPFRGIKPAFDGPGT